MTGRTDRPISLLSTRPRSWSTPRPSSSSRPLPTSPPPSRGQPTTPSRTSPAPSLGARVRSLPTSFPWRSQHEPVRELSGFLRKVSRGGDVPDAIPGSLPQRPARLRERGRADALGDRRAGSHRYAPRPTAVAAVLQPRHPPLPRVPRVLRHGGRDRADRRLLPPCRPGARGTQAGALPARAGGRRQVLDRRAPQGPDGEVPDLRAEGLARQRV